MLPWGLAVNLTCTLKAKSLPSCSWTIQVHPVSSESSGWRSEKQPSPPRQPPFLEHKEAADSAPAVRSADLKTRLLGVRV